MKKWMYVIFPGAMLGLFLVFFLSHQKEMDQREHDRAVKVDLQQKEAAAKKKADEERAHADAEKRAKDRADEDAKKAAEKAAKQLALEKEIKEATDKALAEGDKSAQEAAKLEIDLDRLHKTKEALNRTVFEIDQKIELAKVARRLAEMEEQRTIEMINRKAAESVLTRLPPPPPPPAPAKS